MQINYLIKKPDKQIKVLRTKQNKSLTSPLYISKRQMVTDIVSVNSRVLDSGNTINYGVDGGVVFTPAQEKLQG